MVRFAYSIADASLYFSFIAIAMIWDKLLLEDTYGIEKYGQEIQFLREIHILSNIFKINLVVAKSCKQKPTEMWSEEKFSETFLSV